MKSSAAVGRAILILVAILVAGGMGNAAPLWAGLDCDRAYALKSKGNFHKGQSKVNPYYLEAIEICPGYIRPYELVGNWYRKQGNVDTAVTDFTQAAELGSNNNKLYYLLAKLTYEQGNIDAAANYITKSLSIRKDYKKAVVLAKKIAVKPDREGPVLTLIEPQKTRAIHLALKAESITVRGLATDKSGVAWIKINGLEAELSPENYFLKDIPLSPGENVITIDAQDRAGNLASLTTTVERSIPVAASRVKTVTALAEGRFYHKSVAVVIGVDQYEKWPPLEFAVADALSVKAVFEKAGFDRIITILDEQAAQRRLLTVLGHELPQLVGREDRVVMYFAGHGQTEEQARGGKRGYIIPVDADTTNYFATAISMETIRGLSNRISAKHILYVMDSCYSGLGLNRSAGLASSNADYLRKIASMRTVQIITAGGMDEQVTERDGHGLFTTYLLRAFAGSADANRDSVVTGTELGAYLRPQVIEASNRRQNPLYGRLEGEGEILFPLNSSPRE